jgi:hypothetical protein
MKRLLDPLHRVCDHRRAGPVLLAVVALVYTLAYVRHDLFSGAALPEARTGWWSWADQFEYYRTAAALAHGRLTPDTLHYPPGYAALGTLGGLVWPAQPFFLPDLVLVLVAAWAWWRLAQRLVRRLAAVAVVALFTGTHWFLLADAMVVPWNTLGTQATLLAAVAVVVTVPGRRAVGWLAGLAAATYLMRPVDAAAFAPLLGFAVVRLETWRERLIAGTAGAGVVLAAVVALGALNLAVFGEWRSPYEREAWQAVGFFSYPTTWKFLWLFVDGRPFFGETAPALLFRYPWLYLAVPGAAYWVRKEGAAAGAGLAALALNWTLYVNYNDLVPSAIYRFTLIHYLLWGFWLLWLFAVAAIMHAWRDTWGRAGFAAGAALLVFCFGLRLEEKPLPAPVTREAAGWRLPESQPVAARFPNLPSLAAGALRIDGRALREGADYLAPHESKELYVLFGARTRGASLGLAGDYSLKTPPQFSEFRWNWRAGSGRLKWFGR